MGGISGTRVNEDGLTVRQEKAIIAADQRDDRRRRLAGQRHRRAHAAPLAQGAQLRQVLPPRAREAFSMSIAMTQRYAAVAVNNLAKIMNDPSSNNTARVSAAVALLRYGRESIELDDLAARVDQLEEEQQHEGAGVMPRPVDRQPRRPARGPARRAARAVPVLPGLWGLRPRGRRRRARPSPTPRAARRAGGCRSSSSWGPGRANAVARPLARRVARLERAGGPACPACGGGGPGPVTFRVVVPEAVGRVADRVKPPGPRRCGLCGRPTEVFVRFPEARAGA